MDLEILDLEILILSEVCQKEKDKFHITDMYNLKYGTNEPIYETNRNQLIDVKNRLVIAKG